MPNKPRKPWLAGLFTFLTIGLGHIYAGAAKRGLILFFAQAILLLICLPLFFLGSTLVFIIISISLGFGYFLFCLLDAIRIAKAKKVTYHPKKYNKWYGYLSFWVVAAIIIQPIVEFSVKSNIIQAYKIPSSAMIPTLYPGDHILVDKLVYKNHELKRGDLIIFPYPSDPSKDFVKRIIGLEGDIIEIKNKILYLNNDKYIENYIVNDDPNTLSASQNQRDYFGPITVPNSALFVMGDSRDRSFDSRFWGTVDKGNVKGKVRGIYWSWDSENSCVRWNRVGKEIQ